MSKRKKIFYISLLIFISVAIHVFDELSHRFKNESDIDKIILVTIDTLRADHLSSYGYPRNTSPFIDSMAAQGVRFKNVIAPMATTNPSHASIFTSLYPLQHGVTRNGLILDDSYLTMAEIFRGMGYKTAAFVSMDTLKSSNMNQGFDFFDDPDIPDYNKSPDYAYRAAGDTLAHAAKWIYSRKPGEKFFLWIHLFDPHTPMQAPKSYARKMAKDTDMDEMIDYLINTQHIGLKLFDDIEDRMLQTVTKYDAEILYADTELNNFYHDYETLGLDANTLWVFTSDHGEGLGAHNWWGHGKHIYNEQLKVPLIFKFSSGLGTGRVIENVVELTDIFPTLFELVDKDTKEFDGIKGESLVSFISDSPEVAPYEKESAFSQRRLFKNPASRDKNLGESYESGEKYSFQSKDYKYIYRTDAGDEFYDMRNDPYEVNNLIGSGLKEEAQLKGKLLEKIKELKEYKPALQQEVDEATKERLRSLGYLQ